ncbi:hypothetical protein F4780DRAFT_741907 [Xylariomycetidae sp. FL0641]|nr:hypothetical protein F4780DRAFT_741907 [Xylariomycetidae sp. FL0641]
MLLLLALARRRRSIAVGMTPGPCSGARALERCAADRGPGERRSDGAPKGLARVRVPQRGGGRGRWLRDVAGEDRQGGATSARVPLGVDRHLGRPDPFLSWSDDYGEVRLLRPPRCLFYCCLCWR